MRAVRLPTILGFLLAGIVVGPSGLDLIHHDKVVFFAELGLAMLLFVVGLELSPAPLLRLGTRLLLAAGLQIVVTALIAAFAVHWLFSPGLGASAIGGIAIALSSTAIVLKHLSDRREIDSPSGTLTTGILLLQDIVVIAVLIALPLLVPRSGEPIPIALLVLKLLGALIGMGILVFVARYVVRWLVKHVFRFGGQELMTLFALVMASLGAWLASLADWSWPLGSFIAGLLLAQTDVRHQLRAEITPFQDALNALFFISIGMLFDTTLLMRQPFILLAAVVIALVVKTLVVVGSVRVVGWPMRLSLVVGLGLCTISEFGYVLVNAAVQRDLVPPELLTVFVTWAVGTMLLGALFIPIAAPLAARLTAGAEQSVGASHAAHPDLQGHVIIVGYGINGRNLAQVLRATAIPHSIIEMNPTTALRAKVDDPKAVLLVGDAARTMILEEAGLSNARALVVSIADQEATRRIVAQAHRHRPDLYILARTRFVAELEPLYRLGARQVIPEEFETSIEIFAHVLKKFGLPDNVIDQQVKMVRGGQYAMLRGRVADRTLRAEWRQLLEAAVTQTFLLSANSIACGQSVRGLNLRSNTGVTIVAITRAGQPIPNPDPELVMEAGDVLVLVGTHRQLDEARNLLEPPTNESTEEQV